MKILANLFDRFDHLDTSMNRWLVTYSIPILRVSMGLVFLGFGFLKFFPGISPIEVLATKTTTVLTLGQLRGHGAMDLVATLECIIGVCFITGRFLRVGVWLMGAQMLGAMSPLVLYPAELFPGPLHAPTLAAQYIIKDIILIAAGLIIASTWTGARIVSEPKSMKSTLFKRIPGVYGPDPVFKPTLSTPAKTRQA
ncbi:DoxX family protein [Larkinella humicola]|uniref:DoxX family protein n=1 Tax=Larkinella humicola TaxID=2607654 RepID=UPI00177AE99D|nr:DoxX family protein [Larkinella humicola]